tara:strand:- start:707 stop:1396 length:690 start_codon:yes stop_codon:yes gene_type:complete
MLDKICGPAILYLGFSLIHIVIDAFHGKYHRAIIEVVIMTICTVLLQLLCMKGMTIVSWIIVFIPFILFTYITGIILYVFGLKPKPENQQYDVVKDDTDQQNGGCNGTEFGCCPDDKTPKHDDSGSNCVEEVGGCIGTQYGCCPDSTLAKKDLDGSNCDENNNNHHHHHHHHHDDNENNNNNKNKNKKPAIKNHKHSVKLGEVIPPKNENFTQSIVKPYSRDGYTSLLH